MKNIISILSFILFISCSSNKHVAKTDTQGTPSGQIVSTTGMVEVKPKEYMLCGDLNRDVLEQEFSVFKENGKDYTPDSISLEKIKFYNGDVKVKLFMGTWCGDSKREVPRFFRILDLVKNNHINVELYGLDRTKKDPEGQAEKYKVTNVPTFIFIKSENEIGRITETPQESLEKDMVKILSQQQKQQTMDCKTEVFKPIQDRGKDETKKELLVGNWIWVKTEVTSRAGYFLQTPKTENKTEHYIFTSDGIVKLYENNCLIEKGKYSFIAGNENTTVLEINFETDSYRTNFDFDGKNTLIFDESYRDLPKKTFARITK